MLQHTDRHYEGELAQLQRLLLRMGGLVEQQIAWSIESLVERDSDKAREVIGRDKEINRLDLEIDELCFRLIALHQPAGSDLRFVATAMKITTDLERIGDQAVNVCERVLELNEEAPLKPYVDVPRMAEIAGRMVRQSLDAFVRRDTKLAEALLGEDDEVDRLTRQVFHHLLETMTKNPETVPRATRILFVSKYLERIADHATNIAEDVIYYVEGRDVRHPGQQEAKARK